MRKIPLHSKVRRFLTRNLYSFLNTMIKTKIEYEKIETGSINKILITRLNHRIGNILFLTPLIKALEKKLPHAKVDLLLGADFSGLIGQMPNVSNIYHAGSRSLKNPVKLVSLIKELNNNNYDLLISPSNSSGSSNLSQMFIKGKYKLGFKLEKYISFSNVVVDSSDIRHEALYPLALMDAFDGEKLTYEPYLDLSLSDDEKTNGKEILLEITGHENIDKKITVGIFRDARYDKKIADSYWLELVDRLIKTGNDYIIVDILVPDTQPVSDKIFSVSRKNLRELGSFMSSLDFFITGDTGPMHLASAAKTNIIALFNKTSPHIYGPLGKNDLVIDINTKNIDEVFAEIVNNFN